MKTRITILLLMLGMYAQAQIKVGSNPNTINANSLLEMESTNKGFLPPRVALTSTLSEAPLTAPVPAGMLVFSTGGAVSDGYYYWDGGEWKLLGTGGLNTVTKSANATLGKSETFILASNDITITLPVVTAVDNGLAITVKNAGTHTDLVTVQGNGGALVDEVSSQSLTRFCAQTFIAYNGNWNIKEKIRTAANLLDVSINSSWTTLEEAIEFLEVHMSGPSVIRLGEETYEVSSTLVIDLPYSLTFQGLSYGSSTIIPATGIAGAPLFRCISDCFFKMLQFDATALTNYGTAAGEDAIRFIGNDTYNEVKDCNFDRFYNTILDSSDAEIWVFETDINNAVNNGILIHSDEDSVTVKVAETDFIGCKRGINMNKGSKAIIQLASGGYYNGSATDTAIVYSSSTFTAFISISIAGNSWNNTGKYIEGFDFARSDGRDANVIMESNAGIGDKNPSCYIGVTNNLTGTSTALANTWYKGVWTNTTSNTCKWTIANNRITYQPNNKRDAYITISGNMSVSSSSATINIGLVKNPGATSALASGIIRYGETTLRPGIANQPFQFSTVIYLSDIGPGDFFELWCNTGNVGSSVIFQDIQWILNAK
jgi:hypothetical protein